MKDGYIEVNNKPGLGIDVDETYLNKVKNLIMKFGNLQMYIDGEMKSSVDKLQKISTAL